MPGNKESVRSGVWKTDFGRGPFIPGATEGKVTVQGEQVGDGAWVAGGAHAYETWEGGGGEIKLAIRPPWRGTADIPDGLPDLRRTAELTC